METYHGRWRVTILEKNAGFDQRVLIAGAHQGNGPHAGTPGSSFEVDGDMWTLRIQHDDGSGWDDSRHQPQPMQEAGASLSQTILSEDLPPPGGDFNDLIVRVEKIGPMFEIEHRPFAMSPETLEMYPDGIFVALNGVQLMAVRVTNRWGRALHSDTILRISSHGRQSLAAQGMPVVDAWTPDELASVGQATSGNGLHLGFLEIGESRTVYFKVDAGQARKGKPEVRFHLARASGVVDVASPMRFAGRRIFIAEIGYDFNSHEVVMAVPEGDARLKLNAIVADVRAMHRVCRDLFDGMSPDRLEKLRQLLRSVERGQCDQRTLMAILKLLCRCKTHGGEGDDDSGVPRLPPGFAGCIDRFLWLPADFDFAVRIPGGYTGQFGPLPFEDPWWKVLLIIIAVLLAIAAAIVEATGAGRPEESRRIGTVGDASLNNVDAALIDLDDSRGFEVAVADAITGEPNQNPEVALDAAIGIDPQVAAAFIGMRVIKSGARTGFTHAVVTSITDTTNQCRGVWDDATNTCQVDPNRPNVVMNNQIETTPEPGFEDPSSNSGDSGSLWLSNEPGTRFQLVGLHHSGADSVGSSNPIADVLAELGIDFQPPP